MRFIVVAANFVINTWSIASAVLFFGRLMGFGGHPVLMGALRLWAELRPFYLPAVVVAIGGYVLAGEMLGWNTFYSACYIVNWFAYKDIDDEDDDRWKRRKKKVLDAVARVGARLVVVPAGGGAV